MLFLQCAPLLMAQTGNIRYGETVAHFLNNSNRFKAHQNHLESECAAVWSGSLLENPEVSFGYFGGTPEEIGRRWDLSVSQKLPMPSSFQAQKQLREARQFQFSCAYNVVYHEFILTVQNLCADYLYWQSRVALFQRYSQNASALADLYEKRLAAGDCSILEYNQARMNLAQIAKESQLSTIEFDAVQSQLCALNNGNPYLLPFNTFPAIDLPELGDTTLLQIQNPYRLSAIGGEIAVAKAQEKVARTQWLPDVEVGYASENVVGETFRGATLGLELPLWHNRRNVQVSQMYKNALQAEHDSQNLQQTTDYKALYLKVSTLADALDQMKSVYAQNSSADLLMTALTAGEITLESFLRQQEARLDFELSILDTQYELEKNYILFESYHTKY